MTQRLLVLILGAAALGLAACSEPAGEGGATVETEESTTVTPEAPETQD